MLSCSPSALLSNIPFSVVVDRTTRFFIRSAVLILLVTAIAKLISFAGPAKLLRMSDPVFPFFSNSQLLVFTGVLELAVAMATVKIPTVEKKLALLAGLSTVFLLYRMGLWWMGATQTCKCLGTVMTWLPVGASTVDLFMKLALAYLLFNSFALWLLYRTFSDERG